MERLTEQFEDINEDMIINIVAYLPYKDRIRLERVNRRFKTYVDFAFAQQKVLVTSYIALFTNNVCDEKKHQYYSSDLFVDTGTDYLYANRNSYQVLRRCRNLRTLYWNSHPLATNWGDKLAKVCPLLEHVYFRDLMTFAGFSSYQMHLAKEETMCNIKCIYLGNDDEELSDEYDKEIAVFLKNCPRLSNFFNFSCFNTQASLGEILHKLNILELSSLDNMEDDIDMIREKGINLKRLLINEAVTKSQLDQLVALPKLKHLSVSSDPENMYALLKRDKQWDTIEWIPSSECKYRQEDLSYVLGAIGRKLRALKLAEFNLKSVSLSRLAEQCPNLQELSIYSSRPIVSDIVVAHLAKLTKLRTLELRDTRMTSDGIIELLDNLPKLKKVSLAMFKATDEILDSFAKYASNHPKRRIILQLDYGILNNYRRLADLRQEDVKKFLVIRDNLMVYYVH